MTNSIAEYYLDELNDWQTAIDLYLEAIDNSEEWLQSLLHFNSVPALAAKVEHYLNTLLLSKEHLRQIKTIILSGERILYKDHVPVDDDIVTEELRDSHRLLRKEMHRAEKEYLDTKYDCDEFLASAIEIQNKARSRN